MKSNRYDVIVIGSGFGGSASAYTFSKAGLKTLLLERGSWARRDKFDWSPKEILLNKRYKSQSPIYIKQYDNKSFKPVYPNEVVGGMSVFYGGASLRLREKDFAKWPIKYADLEGYYSQAEQVLEVHGDLGEDLLDPPRSKNYPFRGLEFTLPAQRIYNAAFELGYKPFKIPLAINFSNLSRTVCLQCTTCDGFPCKVEAKNDLAVTVLQKAQAYGLEIMPDIIVRKLIEKNGRIQFVKCIDRNSGKCFDLSASTIVLSAGALNSPVILLRSNLQAYENYRFIGRFLMRHCNAIVTYVFPFKTNPDNIFHKQVCLTDFYEDFRSKYGSAVGILQDIYTPASEVIRHFAPIGSKVWASIMAGFMQNLLCIAEDDPNFDNAIQLSSKTDNYGLEIPKIVHRYSSNDYERRDYLVERARKILKRAGGLISYTYKIDTFSHAVGTVRFGKDCQDSVLNKDCRFWGIENLFVLDGSFMPTSGGVNPSLTIAANAFRVSEFILAS